MYLKVVKTANLKCSHHSHLHTHTHSNERFSSIAQLHPTLTAWTAAALRVSLSITNSWSMLKLMSIESVMPCKVRAVLASFIVIIISQYTCVSNHHVANLQHAQCYMAVISNKTGKERLNYQLIHRYNLNSFLLGTYKYKMWFFPLTIRQFNWRCTFLTILPVQHSFTEFLEYSRYYNKLLVQ